jgi:hypothetical protein
MSHTESTGRSTDQSTGRPTIPRQASRAAEPTEQEPTLWVGWIVFGSMMMLMLGAFHMFQGFVALFQDEYYLVGKNGLTVSVDYTAWGWAHLILGAVVLATGVAVLYGQTWARVTGVAIAMASALVNIAFLAAYPIWSMMMITLDVLVIWALTVHGGEMKSARDRAT